MCCRGGAASSHAAPARAGAASAAPGSIRGGPDDHAPAPGALVAWVRHQVAQVPPPLRAQLAAAVERCEAECVAAH